MIEALWCEHARLAEGWARDVRLTLSGGLVSALETGVPAQQGDQRLAVAIPGLPNLHSHAFQRGMAGLTEARGQSDDSFWSWRALMYRFVERLTPDDVEAIAALAYVEMLEAGFTRVGEFHYLHNDLDGRAYADPGEMAGRIAAAADRAGIGLTLLPVFYAHSGFGGVAPREGQRRFVKSLDGYAALLDASRRAVRGLPDAVVGVAPHSLRAVTGEELKAAVAMAGDAPIHIHIAEQVGEVADCLAVTGARPVRWLLDNAAVDARWCLVHATHLDARELADFAASGAVAGLCPITEANLGDGIFPAADFLDAGGRFGVGSDSNVRIDAAEELRLLEYGQRLTKLARNVLADGPGRATGADLHTRAVSGGGQALGSAAGLRVGGPADIVGLSGNHSLLVGRDGDAFLDSFIFAGGRDLVDSVWRAGRRVVEGGRHVRGEAVRRASAETLRRVLA